MSNILKRFGAVINRAVINKRKSLLLCFFSGFLGALPYFCEKLFILTFLSLFCQFYIAIKQKNECSRIFTPFFSYFIGFYVPLYIFLSELYPYERFGFSGIQAIFVLVCSCIAIPLLHATVESSLMLLTRLFKNDSWSILTYAAIWVIGEWILSLGMLAFPWGGTAVSLTGFLPYLQTASLFGKFFITFVTAAGCYALALAVYNKIKVVAYIGISVILFNIVFGTVLWYIPTDKKDPLSVSAVQGNILSNEKWQSGNSTLIFNRYVEMTKQAALNGADIVVLPESAIPQYFYPNGDIHEALADIARQYDVTVICGVHYYDKITKLKYNSVIAIYPDGSLSKHYDKRHLVPFGEFIPFADDIGKLVPFVGDFNKSSSTLTEGTDPIVIDTQYGKVAPLVCFDSIFPQFAREGVSNDAELIAVVTNDSWFNDSAGIYTHLRHAQLRAIENRRYILRAANTGVSAFINERGQIINQSEPLRIETVTSEVSPITSVTLYTKTGDIVLYISFVLVLINILKYIRSIKNGKNTTSSNRNL